MTTTPTRPGRADPQLRSASVATDAAGMRERLLRLGETCLVVSRDGRVGLTMDPEPDWQVIAAVPPCSPNALGCADFRSANTTHSAYVAGAMAGGIASVALVSAMRRAGYLASFGSGGLALEVIDTCVRQLADDPTPTGYFVNVLHSPQDPRWESGLVEILLRHRVRRIEASAFLGITKPLVHYRASGLTARGSGVLAQNRLQAKVSRVEVARAFAAPAPPPLLRELVDEGRITADQARLAAVVPMADAITVESDSGGHTDSRPLTAMFGQFVAERERLRRDLPAAAGIRIGAAGGLGTPAAVAAAFALGADYVLTGSINQVCREAELADTAKAMLAQAGVADFTMAPAADMFEMGAQVQVLKSSTMFGVRAQRLAHLYQRHRSIDELSVEDRTWLERTIFRGSIDDAWQAVVLHRSQRSGADPHSAEAVDPKTKMALLFRWYLGMSSRWARQGDVSRTVDYQLWAGPALGAFNDWVAGSALAHPDGRSVTDLAANLMCGAAYHQRVQQLRVMGVRLPASVSVFGPIPDAARACARVR